MDDDEIYGQQEKGRRVGGEEERRKWEYGYYHWTSPEDPVEALNQDPIR